ncbi:MAG TPA: UrcA family protein [Caulobacteraceae bacterium]|nr:UrcA family protein [Caulobacteraceae bacterium]
MTDFSPTLFSKSRIAPAAMLALCASLAVGAPLVARANAPIDRGAPSVTLRYDRADARTPQGARRLATRVRHAADELCDGDDPIMRMSQGFEHCRTATIRRAVADANEPMLAQALGFPPTAFAQAEPQPQPQRR